MASSQPRISGTARTPSPSPSPSSAALPLPPPADDADQDASQLAGLPRPPPLRIPSSESSSDDGYRMSPAAARRFARRNMRRDSPTPDLVTSLVRPPPSPDSYYSNNMATAPTPPPPSQPQSRPPRRRQTLLPHRTSSSGNSSGRRPSGPALTPHPSSLDIPAKYGGASILDLYSLTYVADPDPILMCPICHDPMVDPVTTPCDHTFCYRCLRRSIASSPAGTACPVDRDALSWPECVSAGRLVRAQLNGLLVRCPNRSRGCNRDLRRENVEFHALNECRFRQEYSCPDPSCTKKKLSRKPSTQEKDKDKEGEAAGQDTEDSKTCQHIPTPCRLCNVELDDQGDADAHLATSCPASKTRCLFCWQLVVRSALPAHHDVDCDGVMVPCSFADVGCPVRVERGDLTHHLAECPFHPETASGAVIRSQRDLLQTYSHISSQLDDFQRQTGQGGFPAFRHGASSSPSTSAAATVPPREGASGSTGTNVLSDHRTTFQDVDAGFEEVHQNLTHLEARQSMWTLNQVMPIREEVTELRNNINMMRMHVNWLLNRSREEGRIRAAANSAASAAAAGSGTSGGSSSAGSGGASASLTGLTTVHVPRRRSSGTDMDVPRL